MIRWTLALLALTVIPLHVGAQRESLGPLARPSSLGSSTEP